MKGVTSMLKKKKLQEQPLYYWEEKSFMMAIPKNEDTDILRTALNEISSSKEIVLKENKYDVEKNFVSLKVEYEDTTYEVGIYVGGVSVPEYYVNSYIFDEETRDSLLKAKKALTIFMEYKGNPKKCYHLQLKLACLMVPDLIGVLDESAEKMLPAKWVIMAAKSNVLPGSKNLFSVQSIVDEKGEKIWLHTHGLCRCGYTELEIVNSDKEHQFCHYNLILTYGMYLLDGHDNFDPRVDGAYIGRLTTSDPIVVTCRSWVNGLEEYPKLDLGGLKDRATAHNSMTSIIFLYMSEENQKKGIVSKLSTYDDELKDNPLFFYSDEETARMKSLAMENFEYIKKGFKSKDNTVILKIGLPLDDKGNFEHIWFELLEIKGDKFKAKLTQEPYYFPDIHEGYEDWYTKENVTDWIIYTKNFSVTPDTAFLLDK